MPDTDPAPPPDLVEVGARFKESLDNFQQVLTVYDTAGRDLVEMVIERLERQLDPAAGRFSELVVAADELRAHLRQFTDLRIQLASSAGYMGYAVTSRIASLQGEYPTRLAETRPAVAENVSSTEAITQYVQALKSAGDTSSALVASIAIAIGNQAIEAFAAATDLLLLRMYRLITFLNATQPPEAITSGSGWTYTLPAVRDVAAREAAFMALEEALKHVPTEFAGQVPILGAAVSISRIAADVRNEIRAMDERRALWDRILNSPWERGPDDATFDGRAAVREDDLVLQELFRLISDYADKLLSLPPLTGPSAPPAGA